MISEKALKDLYYQLLRIRMVEETIAKEYKKQEMRCPVHLCIGHEAIPVGICANLKKEDIVLSNHRSHGHFLAKGGDLKGMIAEIYGKVTGCSKGRGGSQHLIDLPVNFYGATPIVGGTIPVATGIAWANKLKKRNIITAVFFGDAATEEGVFHESLNFAVLNKLPILYVCENNLYSIFTHISERQPKRDIYTYVKAYGINAWKEDGNDVLKVYESGKKVTDHIKKGKGPVFIEFSTYRIREHCGPDLDPPGSRPIEEYKKWSKKNPIERMERYLKENNLLKEDDLMKIRKKIGMEIMEAFNYAHKSPYLEEELTEKLVYAK